MIEKYIKDLLHTHDCIIVPGFGGFITHYKPVEIHSLTYKFNPPSKSIAFNEKLNVSDGLLLSYIAREENKSREEVVLHVKKFVDALRYELSVYNLYTIKDVGRFFLNKHHHLEFEPENSANYLDESFGLTELYCKPIERNFNDMSKIPPRIIKPAAKKGNVDPTVEPIGSKENESIDQKFLIDVDGETESKSLSVLLIIPLILLISSMGLLFYMNQNGRSLASIFPGKSGMNHAESLPNETKVKTSVSNDVEAGQVEDAPSIAMAPVDMPSVAPEPEIKKAKSQAKSADKIVVHENTQPKPVASVEKESKANSSETAAIVESKTGKYYIIVGSFAEKANAHKLNKKILRNGGSPSIIVPNDKNQFYKVAVEDFNDSATAISKLETYKAAFGEGIWVMVY